MPDITFQDRKDKLEALLQSLDEHSIHQNTEVLTFSWLECDCCGSLLAGQKFKMITLPHKYILWFCLDCMYLNETGQELK